MRQEYLATAAAILSDYGREKTYGQNGAHIMTATTHKERRHVRDIAEQIKPSQTVKMPPVLALRFLNDADRLAAIEWSLEALADRMRIADENLTHDGRHREAQFVRDWLSDVRAIIDAPSAGGEG